MLLTLLVAVLAYHHARRHGSTLIALCMAVVLGIATQRGVEAAVTMIMDGEVADWSGIAPIATDPGGDSSSADSAEDIRAAFITADAQTLYFRLDIADVALPLPGQVTGVDLLAASDTGASNSDNLTMDSTPSFSWNSLTGATGYKISDDGGSSWQDV